MYALTPPLHLRHVSDSDQAFLDALYRSTRADLTHIEAEPGFVAGLIDMQQTMQAHGFRQQFPAADYLLLECGGERIGRLVLAPSPLRIVDLALLPSAQGKGIATAVLKALQCHAAANRSTIELSVSKNNPGARRLYLTLGFHISSVDDLQEHMRWSAAQEQDA
ncbi:ribosomal protein S18 acetylase RimI-like enzyme [Oxalobacteraceae bacterium GrIS 1.11]